jgi:hypothetical protein
VWATGKLGSRSEVVRPGSGAGAKQRVVVDRLGEALVESNQTTEAKRHLQQAIELDGKCGMAWGNLMRCYLLSQQFTEALRAADRACELMPDFPMA